MLYYPVKAYLRLMHESLLVRRRYTIGKENIPAEGEKYFIVCNHQNCVNDPLNIMFALPLRYKTAAMARADILQLNRLFTAFFNWINLVPAFRFGWEGGEGLEYNFHSFDLVAEHVNAGQPFMVFPEAGHTQGHYLDRMTTGTARMAFHVAESNNWQEDIKILPAAHHYEDYFAIHKDFLLIFSEPISLKPYYERFLQHPNSAMREVTHLIRERIQSMMLDEGKDDYAEKDFLRTSALNPGSRIASLESRLKADKQFIASLIANDNYKVIILKAMALKDKEQAIGIDDQTVDAPLSIINCSLLTILLILLLPIWILTLFPHVVCYYCPTLLLREDIMFTNSYRYILSALGLYPLFAVLSIIIGCLILGWWWQTILWILLWIPCARFCLAYYELAKNLFKNIRWHLAPEHKRQEIINLRKKISKLIK